MSFEPAPELPAWLQAEMPFNRRVYRGGLVATSGQGFLSVNHSAAGMVPL
jgi:hypothetical protein